MFAALFTLRARSAAADVAAGWLTPALEVGMLTIACVGAL